jgi:hypothetical protein
LYIDNNDNIIIDKDSINQLNSNQQQAVLLAQQDDPTSLNNVGLAFLQDTTLGKKNISLALKLFERASIFGSILAANNIGKLYFEGVHLKQNKPLALQWFKIAGANNHQGALYNCGLIYAQGLSNDPNDPSVDLISALEYFRLSYLTTDSTSSSSLAIKDAALKSHSIISDKIVTTSNHDFSLLKRLWYASSLNLPSNNTSHINRIFDQAIDLLVQFNEIFVTSQGSLTNSSRLMMLDITNLLGSLVENHLQELNNVQIYVALDNINDMIGPLAGKTNDYVHLAGIYAEALMVSHYCYNKYAIKEADTACFNGAASAAMSYLRRSNSNSSVNTNISRVFQLATSHPYASTKWLYQSQTPRVFHEGLLSKPWWDSNNFKLVQELKDVFNNNLMQLQSELDEIISLNEGSLRVGGSVSDTKVLNESTGLQRIFTPYIGVRSDDVQEQSGAGAWSEFGPLFDGVSWSKKCDKIPLLCNVLKHHSNKEICGSSLISSAEVDVNGNTKNRISALDIEDKCGSDTLVTILRLRPKTHILPHCGTTNRRLIMHFALRGHEGVRFRVGDEWRGYGADGNAIVFDDSYEHEVYHGGNKDRYILLVVLAHPDAN